MTQNELAEKIGVTDKAVSRWETGKGFPDVSLLPSLAEILGVSISEIVVGEKIEIEEKKALEIMDKAVINTLDYSHQEERSNARFKKYVITTASIVIVLLMVFAFFYIRDWGQRDEFVHDGGIFRLIKVSSKQITLRDAGGDDLLFTKEVTTTLIAEYKGNTVRYGGGHGGLTGLGYTFSDGTRVTAFPLPELSELQQQEVQLIDALRDYFDSVSSKYKHPFYYSLLLIIVIATVSLSMYLVLFTEKCWECNPIRRLFIRSGEPSDFSLFANKVGGIAAIIASFLIFLSLMML